MLPRSLDFHSAQESRHLFERPLRCREADALQRLLCQRLQPLQGQGKVRAALGGNQRVNLVDDDGVDGAQRLGGLRGEHQIERLRRGDENLGRMPRKARALALRRVAGAHADLRIVERDAHAARHVGDAGQRRAQIALHVDCQRLQRRNVNDTATLRGGVPRPRDVFVFVARVDRLQHESVQAPQKCRQGFTRACRREDQRILAACDDRPAHALRGGRFLKDGLEPRRRDRMKAGKRVSRFGGFGWERGHGAHMRLAQCGRRRQSEKTGIKETRERGSKGTRKNQPGA